MPTYEFICRDCNLIEEEILPISKRDSHEIMCSGCSSKMERAIISAPQMTIPANMTHDGQRKVIGMKPDTEARVPLNIIDELPDGSTRVTRIGRKEDIDNE